MIAKVRRSAAAAAGESGVLVSVVVILSSLQSKGWLSYTVLTVDAKVVASALFNWLGQEVPSVSVLNLNDPEIRINVPRTLNIGINIVFERWACRHTTDPNGLAFGIARLGKDIEFSIEVIDFDEHDPC